MKRAIVALFLLLLLVAIAYGSVLLVGAWAGGWTAETTRDQGLGLMLHAGIVLLRGLLPVLAIGLGIEALLRGSGRMRGPASQLLCFGAAALLIVPALLTRPGGSIPHLEIERALDGVLTVALLAVAGALAAFGADRLTRRNDGPDPSVR